MADQARMPGDDFEAVASGARRGGDAFPEELASGAAHVTPPTSLRGLPFALIGVLFLGAGLLTATTGIPFGSSRTAVTIVLVVGVVSTLLFFASNEANRG